MGLINWFLVILLLASAMGCGGGGGDGDADGDVDADADADGDESEDGDVGDGDLGDADDGSVEDGDIGPVRSIFLPQAVGGELFANNEVYDEVPLHIATVGRADSVSVRVGAIDTVEAELSEESGDWIAMLPLSGVGEGTLTLEVTARGGEDEVVVSSSQLTIVREGVQLTYYDDVGSAGTPRLHRRGDELWITWVDRRDEGTARAWLNQIDGAGHPGAGRVQLIDTEDPVLYARTAFGESSIGILFQTQGSPYFNKFTVVDFEGVELLAPIDLDPPDWWGSWGGDIEFDGAAFVAVYRAHNGPAESEIRWLRVVEETLDVTGPVVVAEAGPGNEAMPTGGFDPFIFIDVAPVGDQSLVSFPRGYYDSRLELEIPKAQVAVVSAEGEVLASEFAIGGPPTDFMFGRESRVFAVGDGAMMLYSALNLTDPDTDPPQLFYASTTDDEGNLDPLRAGGTLMFHADDDRDEPVFVPHPQHFGVLAWLDHRAYTLEPEAGRIELYAASVNEDLTTNEPVVFPQARFVAGTSLLQGVQAGTNVLFIWVDERHGSGIADPRPELFLETVWF